MARSDVIRVSINKMYSDAGLIDRIDLPFVGTLGQLHWGVIGALLLAIVGGFVLFRTILGFQIKVMGDAPRAGQFAGFNRIWSRLA